MKICRLCKKEKEYILKEKQICQNCNSKEYYKQNRQKVIERTNKRQKELIRKRRGLPLDHPDLIAKPGEGHLSKTGYKYITAKGHPNSRNCSGIRKNGKKHIYEGRIYEHTYIMSQHLGRPLTKTETVHHINGIRNDNRIENLELWDHGQPPGQREEDRIKYYIEYLEYRGYKVTKCLQSDLESILTNFILEELSSQKNKNTGT